VLDFIGNARQEFRFDRRFRALLGGTTRRVERQIEAGFPYLPPGCAIQLDPQAQAVVLGNIRRNIGAGQRWLTEELIALGPDATLGRFLREAGVGLTELYANKRSFASLRQAAFGTPALDEEARDVHARLRAVLHVTDPERLRLLRSLTLPPSRPEHAENPPSPPPRRGEGREEGAPREARLTAMVAAALLDCRRPEDAPAALESARRHEAFRSELVQLLDYLEDERREATFPWRDPARLRPAPLHVHARYRQEEVLAALGVTGGSGQIPRLQAGVFYVEEENIDLLFVTLRKTDPSSPTGRRYLAKTSTVLLFVRETQEQPNGVAEPYWFLGPVALGSASGERPMQLVWRLAHPMPGHLYQRATVAAG
jgi:hypothetical protein